MREEEGDPDERARRVGGGAGKRDASEQRRQVGPGAQGERATRGGERELTWERGAGRAGLCARVSFARRLFWAGLGEREREEEVDRAAGPQEKEWAAGKGEVGCGFGLLGWAGVLGFLSYSISVLFSIPNSNKLNPNESKFEFEFTQALKQFKPMLQHDATTKFKLMIKF